MILDKIVAHKVEEVAIAKAALPLEALKAISEELPPTKDFYGALKNATGTALIAEVKKASPSKGVIREDFDPAKIARIYSKAGASAISVLTDEDFFQGSLNNLRIVRQNSDLPLLRKDFIIDPYQIYEARCNNADAVLLIASILDDQQLSEYIDLAHQLGMAVLLEVHTALELERALRTKARIIGVNNRDLQEFKTNLQTTINLAQDFPSDRLLVSESGINTAADVQKLANVGVKGILVGEALMREEDIAAKIKELLG